MIDNLKKILNEDQDPKAIEKITAKLENLLMNQEEVGYIAVQKKPAVTILPDSIVVTNKRIIICKPKNLGLSLDFTDFSWDEINACFVKEGILGSEFTFQTKFELNHTIDYLPKNQARKLYTYAKEQMDKLKSPAEKSSETIINTQNELNHILDVQTQIEEVIEETPVEEVTSFAELMPAVNNTIIPDTEVESPISQKENPLANLSKEELFDKLQNYKKLLDNGLILQGEYDKLKNEIINYL